MIPLFFILFVFISFIAIIEDHYLGSYKTVIFIAVGIILMIYAGFRDGDAVNDYKNYIDFFNDPNQIVEPSFTFISFIVKEYLNSGFILVFIIYACLGVGTKLIAIKKLTPLLFLSLLVYFVNIFLLHELTQIRVGVASGLLLLTIKPLYERSKLKFLLYSSLAILFHYSALLILLLWFLPTKKVSKLVLYALIPLGFLIYSLKIDLILTIPIDYVKEKVTAYKEIQEYGMGGFDEINVFNLLFLLRCILYYCILFKYNRLEAQNKYFPLLLTIYAISLFSFPAFAIMPVMAFRIHELFCVVEVILLPLMCYLVSPRFFSKLIIAIICFGIALINIFYVKLIF